MMGFKFNIGDVVRCKRHYSLELPHYSRLAVVVDRQIGITFGKPPLLHYLYTLSFDGYVWDDDFDENCLIGILKSHV